MRQVVIGLAAAQLLDAVGGWVVPSRYVQAHLEHLSVPTWLRPALGPIKVSGSAGLLLGLRSPKLGAVTSAGLVSYYAAAAAFHVVARDHPVVAVPAAGFGTAAGCRSPA